MAAAIKAEQPPRGGAIDAIAWLDPPIVLDASLIGKSFRVRINGRAMTATLPTGAVELESPVSSPPAIPKFPPPPLAQAFEGPSARTRVRAAHDDHEFAAGAIRLRFRDQALAQDFSKQSIGPLADAVDGWVKTVRAWLYIWSTRPGHAIDVPPKVPIRVAIADNPDREPIGAGGSHAVIVAGERAATVREWRSALHKASAGETVPLPYALLADAILRRPLGEPRIAVITACSAAEVALSEIARTALKGAGRDSDEMRKLEKARGIADLYRLCLRLPTHPPPSLERVIETLAQPRNQAAHGGKEPDEEEVADAVRTAVEIVATVPRPEPGR